jgi:16S rRNA (cytosine967-C5)-methyltransferase
MTTVRLAAAEVLLAVGRGRTTLANEVDRARMPLTDRRDRALLVELTAGTLRWRGALDALIELASRRPVRDIDERALAVLRLGVYQQRYLTRVPPHAIVNESVETVRRLGAPRAASFVNAVLRTVVRRGDRLRLPARPADDAPRSAWLAFLSVSLSHPAWLVERWFDRHGARATESWCRFNNTTPAVVVRPLPGRDAGDLLAMLQSRGVQVARALHVSDALCLQPGSLGRLATDDLEQLHIQDEGSQLVARAVAAKRGERVLDLCASPGGKTLVMASDVGLEPAPASTRFVAADYRRRRVHLLAETLRRAEVAAHIVTLDARRALPFRSTFDAVLVDAPCSGLGTLSRDPDVKWSRTASHLADLAADQRQMLRAAADVVRPGGRLVYATCSSEPEENLQVVEAFLAEDARFSLVPIVSGGVPPRLVDERGCLTTLPHRDTIDAFFAAMLVRRNGT